MLSEAAYVSIISLLAPALLLIGVYTAVLALAYKYAAHTAFYREFKKASTPGAILTIVNAGGVYLIVLAISAQYASDKIGFAYSVAAATFGLAMGWVLGIVISPSSKDEQSEFSMLTKAISTFLTGYVLAYFKDIKIEQVQHFLFDRPGVPFHLLIGTACCFSTLAVVFVSRRAEIMKANTEREWFISYAPPDPRHAQALRPDVLATGPFATREEALGEIERIKVRDEFKGITLTAVRVNLLSEEAKTPPAAQENPPAASVADTAKQPAVASADAPEAPPNEPPVPAVRQEASGGPQDQ